MNFLQQNRQHILSNCIPHEIIMCFDRYLPWINKVLKQLTQEKNKTLSIAITVIVITKCFQVLKFHKLSQ